MRPKKGQKNNIKNEGNLFHVNGFQNGAHNSADANKHGNTDLKFSAD